MSEGTYEYACMRAELLGLEKPNKEEFYKNAAVNEITEASEFEDISLQNDDLNNVSGGLNELNSILSGTQKKLNRLKGIYGSFTDLIKNKLGGSKDNMSYSTDPSYIPIDGTGSSNSGADSTNKEIKNKPVNSVIGKDINQQISSQVDKLDSLLNKAETADISMNSQNKQMKKFLLK